MRKFARVTRREGTGDRPAHNSATPALPPTDVQHLSSHMPWESPRAPGEKPDNQHNRGHDSRLREREPVCTREAFFCHLTCIMFCAKELKELPVVLPRMESTAGMHSCSVLVAVCWAVQRQLRGPDGHPEILLLSVVGSAFG